MEKPIAKITGENRNILNILSICNKALKENGQSEKIKELTEKVWGAESQRDALRIMAEYCELS